MSAIVTVDGLQDGTPSTDDLVSAEIQWAIAGPSTDTIAATYTPGIVLMDGLAVGVRTYGPNTTTTPTFAPDDYDPRTIVREHGVPLLPGEMPEEAILRYNATHNEWVLQNPRDLYLLQTWRWAIAGGTAQALTAIYDPAIPSLGSSNDGMVVRVRAASANTATAPTFAPNGLTAYAIKNMGGFSLSPGDIAGAGHELILQFHYDAGTPWWELINPTNRFHRRSSTGGTVNAITAVYSPTVAALNSDHDGLLLTVRAAGANTSNTVTFAPNGLTARNILKEGGRLLALGDIRGADHELLLMYHHDASTPWWELLNPANRNPNFKYLDAAANGTDVNTAQPWFPTAGGVSVSASTDYEFEGTLHMERAAGTNSHTTSLLFGGTATLNGISYEALSNDGADILPAKAAMVHTYIQVATAVEVKGASTSATEVVLVRVRGMVRVNAAGTLIPQFIYSAAPGGAPSIKAGTFFSLRRIGGNPQGAWS